MTTAWVDRANEFDLVLPRKYKNVRKIRLTFTSLNDNRRGDYPWRAMLQDVKAYTGKWDELHFGKGYFLKVVGNYRDYTQVVKWVCGWGGFFWPPADTGSNFWKLSGGGEKYVEYDHYDPTFVDGRVWGTLQATGTAGIADLGVDLFDKKPLMDVINYVRDIVGFVFHVDEWGGIIWRMPNLYDAGNYLSTTPDTLATRQVPIRTSDYITIDEKETLLSYSTVLSSENLRERIFVANVTGKVGVCIEGFKPTNAKMRRVAGWTDQHFKSRRETVVMADMIAARQMFDYRRTNIVIPGNPAIQLDDQVRVFERTTNETYYHYVLAIRSDIDMESGEWTYEMNTHWLGQNPEDAWLIDVTQLDQATQNYLSLLTGTSTTTSYNDESSTQ